MVPFGKEEIIDGQTEKILVILGNEEADDVSSFALEVDPEIFALVRGDMYYEEVGYKLLECVDMLVFRIDSDQKIKFLLIKRVEITKNEKDWEYPKGGMEYHKSRVRRCLKGN